MEFSLPPAVDFEEGLFPDPQNQALLKTLRGLALYAFGTREEMTSRLSRITLTPEESGTPYATRLAVQDMLSQLRDESAQSVLPRGSIIAFDGGLVAARRLTGFDVCDGSREGVPDLRDRFLIGAAADADAGAEGGCTTVSVPLAEHSHAIDDDTEVGSTCVTIEYCSGACCAVVSLATHVHPIDAPTENSTPCSTAVSVVPPYYAIIYIRKK